MSSSTSSAPSKTGQSKSALALRRVLETHTAEDITAVRTSGVVELDSELSPIDAANILWRQSILGAPVWNKKESKYVGFFDMRDILSAVTASAKAVHEELEKAGMDFGASEAIDSTATAEAMKREEGEQAAFMRQNEKSLRSSVFGAKLKEMQLFNDTMESGTIAPLAKKNPFQSCTPQSKLSDLCRVLYALRCHRVPILDEPRGRCRNIISQSALLKFLSQHVATASEELDETLSKAGLSYKKPVVQIADTASAYEAFQLIDSKNLSGIAVVDSETGQLLGNTSARDIKLAVSDVGRTAMDTTDILSYLAAVRQATVERNDKYPSCHVYEDATVRHVVNLLAKTGYHRVFVVDKSKKPVGVISVTDVLKFALDD